MYCTLSFPFRVAGWTPGERVLWQRSSGVSLCLGYPTQAFLSLLVIGGGCVGSGSNGGTSPLLPLLLPSRVKCEGFVCLLLGKASVTPHFRIAGCQPVRIIDNLQRQIGVATNFPRVGENAMECVT